MPLAARSRCWPRPPRSPAHRTAAHRQAPADRSRRSGLVRAYDLILDARFDELDAELDRACGPAPTEACHVLDATALWWRIQLDPDSRALDDEFSTSVERAIRDDRSVDRARA